MKQVPADPRSGSTTQWIRDDDVVELVGTATVPDRNDVPATASWRGRPAARIVFLDNGFWNDCATGIQLGSGATRIALT